MHNDLSQKEVKKKSTAKGASELQASERQFGADCPPPGVECPPPPGAA
jgi:hypothetical protein